MTFIVCYIVSDIYEYIDLLVYGFVNEHLSKFLDYYIGPARPY